MFCKNLTEAQPEPRTTILTLDGFCGVERSSYVHEASKGGSGAAMERRDRGLLGENGGEEMSAFRCLICFGTARGESATVGMDSASDWYFVIAAAMANCHPRVRIKRDIISSQKLQLYATTRKI
mmetsp:Transcript_12804/g.28239  ORF Transcript_12804/g.28239 Transcript_12804/m.28239 type:complete len:124 (-) Transcript_12804:28-399(-)